MMKASGSDCRTSLSSARLEEIPFVPRRIDASVSTCPGTRMARLAEAGRRQVAVSQLYLVMPVVVILARRARARSFSPALNA